MSAPELPRNISPDGREIWDWAAKLSQHTQRLHQMRLLQHDITEIGRGCGHCDKWMKSRVCPRERNVNGRNHGPSMKDPVCSQYVEKASSTNRREELKAKLDLLQEEHINA